MSEPTKLRPDFLFTIVQVPPEWEPESVFDVPELCALISETPVASFDEAYDDLVRCNSHAMKEGLRQWAVIQMPDDYE